MKKTRIIVLAAVLAIIILVGGVVAIVGCRNKDKKEEATTTVPTTTKESETAETESTFEEETPTEKDKGEDVGGADTEKPTDEEEETEASGEGAEPEKNPVEKPTNSESEPMAEGTIAPTKEPVTMAPTEAPTQAPTQAPTEAPTQAPTEAPTEAPKPLTDEEKLKAMGVTYEANAEGGVTITGGKLVGDVVIPATIDGKKVTVGNAVYENTPGITSLVINCEVVEPYAFSGVETLKSVVIGADVEVLGEGAFFGCKNLESVTFMGEKITEIPMRLFGGCLKLLSLTLPRSVTKVYAGSLYANAWDYASEAYPSTKPPKTEWGPIIPEFTLYVYKEPDLIYEDFIEYMEYGSLEEELSRCRIFNYKIVYK